MKNLEFPIIGTKVKGLTKIFDITSPQGRKEYYEAKVGTEIAELKEFFKDNTFIAYMLGKKNSGKGTYSKIFTEVFGSDKVVHISIGDIVRSVHIDLETKEGRKSIEGYLKKNYRGYISVNEGIEAILNRSTEKVSVPDEVMLCLIEREIDKHRGKSMFIDGFPRTLDQVSYSLFFRDLMGHRDDPDFFVLIDIAESIIDQRIKTRVVCPKCGIPRSTKLAMTSKIEYDKKDKKFYLLCDNPECGSEARLTPKEGDNLGIEPIRPRLEQDEEILRRAFSLYGVPKILLRNHIPVNEAKEYFDGYEITPEYGFKWNSKKGKVEVTEKPWVVKDDNGVSCISLLPAPVVTVMIKQMVEVLEI
jgi:adenylate kinase family enzyme